MTTRYVTVDEIIRSLLSQEGKNTPHDYVRYLDIANRGMKELTFDILGATKVALLQVSSTMRIDLPDDYVDYVYVGVIGSDNLAHTLGADTKIPASGGVAGDAEEGLLSGTLGSQFGMGGGQNSNGYYKPQIDFDNWQMIVSSMSVGEYVYLEYISDGRASNGSTVIHPYAEEALRSYIFWKSIQRRRSAAQSAIYSARSEYFNEKRLAKKRLCAFTKEEALKQIRTGFKQSPKM